MRRAFTMIEMLLAVLMVGVLTTLSFLTFSAVTEGWQRSTDYIDKLERTDFALEQIISALRSAYYPHNGAQEDAYGFILENRGEGENERNSDRITWSKKGSAIVGSASSIADSVHRVQVMVLEEGNNDYRDTIEVTGLYARLCSDSALRPNDDNDETDYSFENPELYEPVLIADGIVGFNCRVMATKLDETSRKGEKDDKLFEDDYTASNSLPYKVELTFKMKTEKTDASVMRIVTIPIHEQSLDGSDTPAGRQTEVKKGGVRR